MPARGGRTGTDCRAEQHASVGPYRAWHIRTLTPALAPALRRPRRREPSYTQHEVPKQALSDLIRRQPILQLALVHPDSPVADVFVAGSPGVDAPICAPHPLAAEPSTARPTRVRSASSYQPTRAEIGRAPSGQMASPTSSPLDHRRGPERSIRSSGGLPVSTLRHRAWHVRM